MVRSREAQSRLSLIQTFEAIQTSLIAVIYTTVKFDPSQSSALLSTNALPMLDASSTNHRKFIVASQTISEAIPMPMIYLAIKLF
jgi:hypothetical protein